MVLHSVLAAPFARVLAAAGPLKPLGLKPDLVTAFVILDIAIILLAARLVGGVFRRLGQPRVVGEIVAGVLLGPTLLGPAIYEWHKPWHFLHCDASIRAAATPTKASITTCFFPAQARGTLGTLGQIALILFMFLVGLELDPSQLKGKGKAITSVAVGVVALPFGLAWIVGPALYDGKWVGHFGTALQPSKTSFTLMVAALLAVTAFPVMARILQEKGLVTSTMGSVGVAAAAIVTVLMFLLVAVARGVASNQGTGDQVLRFVGVGIYIGLLFFVIRPLLARTLGRAIEASGTLTIETFAAIVIFAFANGYAADRFGINVIPGAFLAGAVLPARRIVFREMTSRLSDLTAVVLLPIFLAFSGLQTDFTKLGFSFVGGIVLFLVAGIVGKWLGGAVSARVGGLSWREGNILGILMNCRGLLVLVVALIAVNAGVISPQLQVAAVLMALVTTIMTGPLFDRFRDREAVPEKTVAEDEAPAVARP